MHINGIYIGEFNKGDFHGLGEFYNAEGILQERGLYKNNKFVRKIE